MLRLFPTRENRMLNLQHPAHCRPEWASIIPKDHLNQFSLHPRNKKTPISLY
jgi:hypothetical protein